MLKQSLSALETLTADSDQWCHAEPAVPASTPPEMSTVVTDPAQGADIPPSSTLHLITPDGRSFQPLRRAPLCRQQGTQSPPPRCEGPQPIQRPRAARQPNKRAEGARLIGLHRSGLAALDDVVATRRLRSTLDRLVTGPLGLRADRLRVERSHGRSSKGLDVASRALACCFVAPIVS